MSGVKNIYLLAGEASFGCGEAISANLSTGEATGAHLTGVLGQSVYAVSENDIISFYGYLSNLIIIFLKSQLFARVCIFNKNLTFLV